MSRKYRQRGYMRDDGEKRQRRTPQSNTSREGPRAPRMTQFQKVVRCKTCGKLLPPGFEAILQETSCPNCQSDLHTCTNCSFFDPASRFECTKPIAKRVSPKDAGNDCSYFKARRAVEKQTTSNPDHEDPRDAFDRLFKS